MTGNARPRGATNSGSGSDVAEDLPSRRPHSVVAVIGPPTDRRRAVSDGHEHGTAGYAISNLA